MKTLNGLMKHLRDKGIETHGSVHKRKMKNLVSKTECYQLIRNYSSVLEDLHGSLSSSDFHKIVKTGARSKMDALRRYIAAS